MLHMSYEQHKHAWGISVCKKTGPISLILQYAIIQHNSKAGAFLNTLRKFTFMHTKTISKFRTRNLSHHLLTSHTGTPGNHAQFQSIKYKIKWESCSMHFFPCYHLRKWRDRESAMCTLLMHFLMANVIT